MLSKGKVWLGWLIKGRRPARSQDGGRCVPGWVWLSSLTQPTPSLSHYWDLFLPSTGATGLDMGNIFLNLNSVRQVGTKARIIIRLVKRGSYRVAAWAQLTQADWKYSKHIQLVTSGSNLSISYREWHKEKSEFSEKWKWIKRDRQRKLILYGTNKECCSRTHCKLLRWWQWHISVSVIWMPGLEFQ